MKKQIVYIHGGTAFSKYDAFIEYLKAKPITDPLDLQKIKLWKYSLAEQLGGEYEMYMPTMPNSQNAKYAEWKMWFERYFEFLHDGVILIGHSQGGYFLAKYLSENTMPVRIAALYLVAAPFEPADFGKEDGGDFSFDSNILPHLAGQVDKIFLFHSKDDPIVPYTHAEKFKEAIPEATLYTFEHNGHFIQEEFPEIIASIREL